MKTKSMVQVNIDIAGALVAKNYEMVIDYANETQRNLIYNWHVKDNKILERLILQSRNILNFWYDSIKKKRLWVALVRCGAWIGTLETIEKSVYEENMDLWAQRRLQKSISSIKHVPEIVGLLEVKGVMTHGEMVEELHLKHASTLTEIMKKTADLDLIEIRKAGKYNLYSLTDAGVRYAKRLRNGEDRHTLLKGIINEYGLRMDEASLDSYLQSADEKMTIQLGQMVKVKTDSGRFQNSKVNHLVKKVDYEEEVKGVIYLGLEKVKEKPFNYKMGV